LTGELSQQLKQKKVTVTVSIPARDWLAMHGYDPQFGARPLGRIIQTRIKDILSEEVLFGKLLKGGRVLIDINNDNLIFDYSQ